MQLELDFTVNNSKILESAYKFKRHIIKHLLTIGHRQIKINIEDAEDMFQDIILSLAMKLDRDGFYFYNEKALYKYLKLAASRYYLKCFRRSQSVNKYSSESSIDLELLLSIEDFDVADEGTIEEFLDLELLKTLILQAEPSLDDNQVNGCISYCMNNGGRISYQALTQTFGNHMIKKFKTIKKKIIKEYNALGEDS